MREWTVSYSKYRTIRMVAMPGAFKLGIFHTFKPNFLQFCTNFCFLLYWGAHSYHPAIGPILRKGNSPNYDDKIASDKLNSTTWNRRALVTGAVHCPFSQFDLYQNFSFESDLKKKLSKIQIQISFKSELKKNSQLNQFWTWSCKDNEGMKGLFLSKYVVCSMRV